MHEKSSAQDSRGGSVVDQVEAVTPDGKHEKEEVTHNAVIKGDDSDGKLDWTIRSFVAYLSLCFVYTGMLPVICCGINH